MRARLAVWTVAWTCLASLPAVASETPPRQTRAVATTPDWLQTDRRLRLPGGGRKHCGPVAAANALVHLAATGWPRLVPAADAPRGGEIDVIRQLASSRYMNTSLQEGTSTTGMLEGLRRFVHDRGYVPRRLVYAGWRRHPRRFAHAAQVDAREIERHLAKRGAMVLLNVGWYVVSGAGQERVYLRKGGHWVTLAGYGVDAQGRAARQAWIVRDPSPRAGRTPRSEFVAWCRLRTGRLEGPQRPLPRSAVGALHLHQGLALPQGTQAALVDGAVLLEIAAER